MPVRIGTGKGFKHAGFDDAQAEAVIDTVGDAVSGNVATKADLQELRSATKSDLQELRSATKSDLQELRSEMKADLQDLELRLTHQFESLYKHLWAMSAGIVTVVVALMKLLS